MFVSPRSFYFSIQNYYMKGTLNNISFILRINFDTLLIPFIGTYVRFFESGGINFVEFEFKAYCLPEIDVHIYFRNYFAWYTIRMHSSKYNITRIYRSHFRARVTLAWTSHLKLFIKANLVLSWSAAIFAL